MKDELSQKKKEIKGYAKDRNLNRIEAYTHIKKVIKELKPKEKKILYKEFIRDKESIESLSDVKELCVAAISMISIILSTFFSFMQLSSICKEEIIITASKINYMMNVSLLVVFGYMCMIILIITGVNIYISSSKNISQYVIDIFEDTM